MTIALVADREALLLMHKECAYQTNPPNRHTGAYWYVADLANPVSGIMGDPCAWCQRRLNEDADPTISEIRNVATG